MPALTAEALRKQLAAGRLAPVYLLTGGDVRQIEDLAGAIEATVDPADQPFAVDRLYAGEPGGSAVDIVASARSLPMLGNRRIVVVLRAEKFLKPKRATRTADGPDDAAGAESESASVDLAPIEAYVKAPVPSTTLVFVAADVDRSRRLTKLLAERGQVVTLAGLEGDSAADRGAARDAAARQVRDDLVERGRVIDPRALRLLVERAGGDISKLRDDVDRLVLYTEGQERISLSDVEEVAAVATSVEDEWAVVNAIADGDTARALREAAARLDRGDSVHALVGQIRWWVSARMPGGAPERVRPALDALLRTDLALKTSAGDERVLVERLVVELTGAPVPRQAGWGGRR